MHRTGAAGYFPQVFQTRKIPDRRLRSGMGTLDGDLRGVEVEVWSVNGKREVRKEMESKDEKNGADEESDACLER